MDMKSLRAELHRVVDEVIDRYLGEAPSTPHADVSVTFTKDQGPWDYSWPTTKEHFTSGRWYTVSGAAGNARALVARTIRDAWGKQRGRVVVFAQTGSDESAPSFLYPWTEFVETDDGAYAAAIPDPSHPRAVLHDGDTLPERFAESQVQRADEVFQSIRSGPSLRLVVEPTDEQTMVEHGYWVAQLRERI